MIHEDYTKPAYQNAKHLRQYVLPVFADENLNDLPPSQQCFVRDQRLISPVDKKYSDPDVLDCQDQYVGQLVPVLRTNPQVFAYELENEMVDCPAAWANHAVGVLHKLDPGTPVCASHGGGGLHTADPLWWHQRTNIDFYNVQHYLSLGVDFDFTTEPDLYQQTCDLNEFVPPEPAQQRFEIPTGWQLSYLVNEDHSEVLVYIRNMAGIAPWEVEMGRSVWRQFLRRRAVRPMAVQLRLPQGRYQLTIRDLDEQSPGKRAVRQRGVDGNERLEFGDTDHDFVLVLRRDAAP